MECIECESLAVAQPAAPMRSTAFGVCRETLYRQLNIPYTELLCDIFRKVFAYFRCYTYLNIEKLKYNRLLDRCTRVLNLISGRIQKMKKIFSVIIRN